MLYEISGGQTEIRACVAGGRSAWGRFWRTGARFQLTKDTDVWRDDTERTDYKQINATV
ncbi:GH10180 [Drosophila grimshawi]|uniref:GH10180 n=1 Tax=Drosophila grimshawi TaxID=7222 RepID=B4JBV6_DROGR|nr:GH10180 [Drosophila grimshawi]